MSKILWVDVGISGQSEVVVYRRSGPALYPVRSCRNLADLSAVRNAVVQLKQEYPDAEILCDCTGPGEGLLRNLGLI